MTLYIGRAKDGSVEVRDYKDGKQPKDPSFRTPTELMDYIDQLENKILSMAMQNKKHDQSNPYSFFSNRGEF